jgi:uncharacterized protein
MMVMGKVAQHFWDSCAAGAIPYQRCEACTNIQFYPRPFCAVCGGARLSWLASLGIGTIYATTTVGRAPTPEFNAITPYGLVLINLDEGFRMMAHGEPGLKVGSRARAVFRQFGGRHLPYFSPL